MSPQNLVTHVGNTAPQDALAQAAQLELGQNPNALAIRRPFDPTAHELEANFRLTRLVNFFKGNRYQCCGSGIRCVF
jgi:hypothetical protein